MCEICLLAHSSLPIHLNKNKPEQKTQLKVVLIFQFTRKKIKQQFPDQYTAIMAVRAQFENSNE